MTSSNKPKNNNVGRNNAISPLDVRSTYCNRYCHKQASPLTIYRKPHTSASDVIFQQIAVINYLLLSESVVIMSITELGASYYRGARDGEMYLSVWNAWKFRFIDNKMETAHYEAVPGVSAIAIRQRVDWVHIEEKR